MLVGHRTGDCVPTVSGPGCAPSARSSLRRFRERKRRRDGRGLLHDLAMLAEIEPDRFLLFGDPERNDQVGERVDYANISQRRVRSCGAGSEWSLTAVRLESD